MDFDDFWRGASDPDILVASGPGSRNFSNLLVFTWQHYNAGGW